MNLKPRSEDNEDLEEDLEELDVSVLNVNQDATSKDVASGQHMVDGDQWVHQSSKTNSLKKRSMGLTSIPSSTTGGELLSLPGTPENPGLQIDEGDETDFFGATDDLVGEVPPKNEKYKDESAKPKTEYDDFISFLNQDKKTANYSKHLGRLAFYFKEDPNTLKKISNLLKK
jgi:hypothetical protein